MSKIELLKFHHESMHLEEHNAQPADRPDFIERFVYGKAGNTGGAKVKKLPAVLITIFLGPFGGHRIYLGTDVKVPVIYTLTLGGGLGLLPLCDLIAVLINDDLNDYADNSKIIMWMKSTSK